MCERYIDKFDTLDWVDKLAYTKGVVVDYIKPWSGNRSRALNSIQTGNSYSFLDPILRSSTVHNEMKELRNKMAAHIDEGYESLGITVRGGTIANAPVRRPKQPGTLDGVFVPVAVRIESARGFWYIDDKDKLKAIQTHILACLEATQDEITQQAEAFVRLCMEHMHVLKNLTDIVSLDEIEVLNPDLENMRLNFVPSGERRVAFNVSRPASTQFGDVLALNSA